MNRVIKPVEVGIGSSPEYHDVTLRATPQVHICVNITLSTVPLVDQYLKTYTRMCLNYHRLERIVHL